MRISFKTLLLAGAMAALPGVASAEWYIGGDAGLTFLQDADVVGTGGRNLDTDYNTGFGLLGQIGYSFGMLAVEGELGYRRNTVDSVGGVSGSGSATSISTMGNLVLDLMPDSRWHPFVGAGIGMAHVDTNNARAAGARNYDGGSWEFAYQGFAGLGYDISDELMVKAQYRYFATTDYDVNPAGRRSSTAAEYDSHNVMIGFTYRFLPPAPPPPPAPVAAPAPPPPPAPVKAMPKNYMVFFDFDRAVITPEAAAIISQAVAAAKEGKMARINLTGHADRSGTDRYNMALSMKRAEAVQAEMVKMGLTNADISVVAKGESDPLVPTPDGVREPQNRRVEIVLP